MKFQVGFSKNSDEYKKAKKVRDIIFVNEDQTTPEEEYDEYDQTAYHFIGYLNGKLICCARLIKKQDMNWYVGRVGVLKEFRGRNIGAELMEFVIKYFRDEFNESELFLNARVYALNFYKRLGFDVVGEPFYEIGIKHVKMSKKIK